MLSHWISPCILWSSAVVKCPTASASCPGPTLLGLRSAMGQKGKKKRKRRLGPGFSLSSFPGESSSPGRLSRQEPVLILCICTQTVDVTGANWNSCLENYFEISHIQGIKGDFVAGISYVEKKIHQSALRSGLSSHKSRVYHTKRSTDLP